MSVLEIIKRNFEDEVIFSDRPMLLLYYDSQSADNNAIFEILEEIAEENMNIKVGVLAAESEEKLLARFEVTSLPTFLVLKTGRVKGRALGKRSKEELLELLKIVID